MTILARTVGLRVSYGRLSAVHSVSIGVPEGGVVALLGPNGAGKSSVLSAIAGLCPRKGIVEFDGERIDALPPHEIARRGVCLIPEGRGVFPSLSVEENLRLAAAPGESGWRDAVLEAFPSLASRLDRQVATLSGGEQQMLSLARAIASKTRLLMLDEPSLGLAPRLVASVYRSIERVKAEGRTILLVEQFARHALRLADVVYVMAHGRVVFAGQPSELPHAPPLVERYLGPVSV